MSLELLKELKTTIAGLEPEDVPPWIRRYYRKLALYCSKDNTTLNQASTKKEFRDHDCIVIEKQTTLKTFVTPYTLRTLKPFIMIDRESEPLRVKLLSQICERQKRQYKRHPIMYKYIEKRHVKAINRLCHIHFWPEIDISEALEFPEFTVVAEYNRVVVGFGFLVPDVSHSDAYISFIFTLPGWRRAGIARFMLYHLINTCRGKDITLHVSASNSSALLLYQQFAFKPEEFIQNFYDKFIPANSRECRHAFFLRLPK
ncbi:cysteine-rich protein 2-binding protein [Macrosteles quadrilineatus]|uniref:cysteine-rich protein 2-binding protein n=1 Tax=Macrosteles quadrilineatus TaxID=74068 RepID=UPI0023E2F67F|nr:cysteine-rich protein 2-binding protein [Macrosteles quadrilineatus]